MRWPWQRTEKRQNQPFTDAIVAAIQAQAEGATVGDPGAIAALETAAGLYARAFAAAKVTPVNDMTRAISPSYLALVARDLIRRGESIHRIIVEDDRIRLQPVGSWDLRGGPDRASWWVRCDEFGPSGNVTHLVPHDAVVHAQYAIDPARPWHGIGPLGWARSTGALAANLELRLGEEAGGSVGHLLPVPQDAGSDDDETDPMASLKADLRRGAGRTMLVESTTGGWGDGASGAPLHDWRPHRFGADPPATLGPLRNDASMAILNACGVPTALWCDADGTGAREGWRRFVLGSVEAVLNGLVRAELAEKLGVPDLHFDLTGLWAHDGAGRASMFQKLVAGGVGVNDALLKSGLMEAE